MTVAIIDYGSGNLRSVAKAFERVAQGRCAVEVTRAAEDVAHATHIVLPGVGAFADCMAGLKALHGMLPTLHEQVMEKRTPFLGVCVGMQMLFETGYEHGKYAGLGWLKGEVMPLSAESSLKIPHMGWNELQVRQEHPIVNGLEKNDHAYFVHSYHAKAQPQDILATTHYGVDVAAVVGRGHIMGVQFHPEKSQEVGLKILSNFLEMKA